MENTTTKRRIPFFWHNHLGLILLVPFVAAAVAMYINHSSAPVKDITVTVPPYMGEAWGRHLLEQEILKVRLAHLEKHLGKIRLCVWGSMAVFFALCALEVQWDIMKYRKEIEATNKDSVPEFDRLVFWQEPRNWLTGVLWGKEFLSASQEERRQRTAQTLADFFQFKLLLLDKLTTLFYILIFAYGLWTSIEYTIGFGVHYSGFCILAGLVCWMGLFFLSRFYFEWCILPFSIQGMLRSIRDRLTP